MLLQRRVSCGWPRIRTTPKNKSAGFGRSISPSLPTLELHEACCNHQKQILARRVPAIRITKQLEHRNQACDIRCFPFFLLLFLTLREREKHDTRGQMALCYFILALTASPIQLPVHAAGGAPTSVLTCRAAEHPFSEPRRQAPRGTARDISWIFFCATEDQGYMAKQRGAILFVPSSFFFSLRAQGVLVDGNKAFL